jgi:rubrerythrin
LWLHTPLKRLQNFRLKPALWRNRVRVPALAGSLSGASAPDAPETAPYCEFTASASAFCRFVVLDKPLHFKITYARRYRIADQGSVPPHGKRENETMDFKGSRTEQAVLTAFAGESQARTRYTFAASVAKKAGYEQIAELFTETADNEKEHAKLFFKLLQGGTATVTAEFPCGPVGTVEENLLAAAEGEAEEWGRLYPDAAGIAESEGFPEIAVVFRRVSGVEKYHERRYRKLLENLRRGQVFEKPAPVAWKCRNCGAVFENLAKSPKLCSVCQHPQAHFELWCENY